jgi:2-polyprenyl-3-methyl-5-hydroxy-6-metoxy-1,4-benzoquinol methylase
MTTIKEHCCGADLFFNKKTAAKEYRHYLKKGPSRVTARIIQQLAGQDITNKRMIDVGGGIGALQWWFLQNGGKRTTDIDASSGYLAQAANHASDNNWQDQAHFFEGDCTDVYSRIDEADYITLDKVVCCYPNYKEILESTCDKSTSHVSLSYPMDGIISQAISKLGALYFMLIKNPYRPFVHPVSEIRVVFAKKGFERVGHSVAFPWHIETYAKSS